MSEQRERRRLVEEARAAHAAQLRRRLIIGALAAALLAGAAVLAYAQFGGGPLESARRASASTWRADTQGREARSRACT